MITKKPYWYAAILTDTNELLLFGPFSEPEYADSWITAHADRDDRGTWVVTVQQP